MAAPPNYFPHFPPTPHHNLPSPPKFPPPSPSRVAPPHQPIRPPPSPHVVPSPPHPITPPPPHVVPSPPHPVFPPAPPHVVPSPPHPVFPPPPPHIVPSPPHPVFPPPPPHIAPSPPHPVFPPPPPPTPGHHTVIIFVFVSLGGLFFLAFLSVALFCFLKKRKKRVIQETDKVKIDEHIKVHEDIVPGPRGTKALVLTIDDDVNLEEEIRKTVVVGENSRGRSVENHHQVLDLANASDYTHHHH